MKKELKSVKDEIQKWIYDQALIPLKRDRIKYSIKDNTRRSITTLVYRQVWRDIGHEIYNIEWNRHINILQIK